MKVVPSAERVCGKGGPGVGQGPVGETERHLQDAGEPEAGLAVL